MDGRERWRDAAVRWPSLLCSRAWALDGRLSLASRSRPTRPRSSVRDRPRVLPATRRPSVAPTLAPPVPAATARFLWQPRPFSTIRGLPPAAFEPSATPARPCPLSSRPNQPRPPKDPPLPLSLPLAARLGAKNPPGNAPCPTTLTGRLLPLLEIYAPSSFLPSRPPSHLLPPPLPHLPASPQPAMDSSPACVSFSASYLRPPSPFAR